MCAVQTAMLNSIMRKSVLRADTRHLSTFISGYTNTSNTKKGIINERPRILQYALNLSNNSHRNFRTNINPNCNKVILPSISKHDTVYEFNPYYAFSCLAGLLQLHFSRIDPEFSYGMFTNAAKHAITIVSNALAREDYESLDGLVYPEILNELQGNIKSLLPEQQSLIAVNEEDMQLMFIYKFKLENDKDSPAKRLEISCCLKYAKNLQELYEKVRSLSIVEGYMTLMSQTLYANYTFTRKYFMEGAEPWIISSINHSSGKRLL